MKFTLQNESFELPAAYAEGYVLNAEEAEALSRLRLENIGNTHRGKIKEILEKIPAPENDPDFTPKLSPEQHAEFQNVLSAYNETYVLKIASPRGESSAMTEDEKYALRVAKQIMVKNIKSAFGITVKDYLAIPGKQEKYDERIAKLVEDPAVKAEAKRLIKEAAKDKARVEALQQVGAAEAETASDL